MIDEKLTEKEIEIIKYLINGYSKKSISKELNESYVKILKQSKNICKKLNAKNLPNAVYIALKNKYIK